MKIRLNPIECMTKLSIPDGRIRMVLDTDTYNEVDDQFALMYALAAPERLQLEAVYAAPFSNDRSDGPEDGMEKSYHEINRLLKDASESTSHKRSFDIPVFLGSRTYLTDKEIPVQSEAAEDLVARAMASSASDPLYVVAIGAITNVASAMIMEPEIMKRIVLVWLGGHVNHWPHTREFNLMQDIKAAQIIFDSYVPLIQIPAMNVTSHMLTSVYELEACMGGHNRVCDTLIALFKAYREDHFAWNKEIWDIAAIAYLVNDAWVQSVILPSPILTDQCTWSFDSNRHFIRQAVSVNRNDIFYDLFKRLTTFYS